MQYDEKTALELKKKFNIPDATITTWKHRGNIPAKYLKDDLGAAQSVQDVRVLDKIKAILDSEKINIAAFCKHAGLNLARVSDFKRGKAKLSDSDVLLFKKHLNSIRINATKIITEANEASTIRSSTAEKMKDFLKKNPEIVVMKVFDFKKLIDWRNDKQVAMTYSDYRTFVDKLAVFCLETKI